ncbi:MAG TPA: sensor domain-containing diguanylate cyclase [Actinobacteria bacterium]|nr:sensor domain-containing diguanylate cyclase [Actinomycetes bacterium]HEX21103.1 sensor domain-containing diguanylate cyclase [Actinomycetota bacterium]
METTMKPHIPFRSSMSAKFIAIILLILIPLITAIIIDREFLLPKITATTNETVEEVTIELKPTSNLQNLVSRASISLNNYVLAGEPRERQEFTRLSKKIDKAFNTGGKHFGLAAEAISFRAAKLEWEQSKTIGHEILNNSAGPNNQSVINKIRRFDRHVNLSIRNLSRVDAITVKEAAKQGSAIKTVISQISDVADTFLFIGLLIAVIIGTVLSRSILKPLKDLEKATVRLSGGNLAYRINNERDDELGRLAQAFNLMAKQLEKSYKLMKTLSTHDQLTGLYNRREFYRRLNEEIKRYRRYGHPFSLMMIDIDLFKSINDNLGHQVGDNALYFIAQSLKEELRPTDHLCRYGGDEFIAILPETQIAGALAFANRTHRSIASSQIDTNDGRLINLTISIGIANFPDNANSVDEIVSAADQALFIAKAAGRNQVRCYKNAA